MSWPSQKEANTKPMALFWSFLGSIKSYKNVEEGTGWSFGSADKERMAMGRGK
jgi:hypothetical protein